MILNSVILRQRHHSVILSEAKHLSTILSPAQLISLLACLNDRR